MHERKLRRPVEVQQRFLAVSLGNGEVRIIRFAHGLNNAGEVVFVLNAPGPSSMRSVVEVAAEALCTALEIEFNADPAEGSSDG